MKKYLLIIAAVLPAFLMAQEKEQKKEAERIIITKKGADNEKLNIVVDGDNITVNGKPASKDDDGDVTVKRIKIKDMYNFSLPDEIDFDGLHNGKGQIFYKGFSNKAMLGVITEKSDQGVKIVNVTDESAAKKAGLKEGDIITTVEGKKIETPDELSGTLKDKKPGDKINITYLRDDKENTIAAALTKWNAPQVMTFNGSGNSFFTMPDMDNIAKSFPRSWNNGTNNFKFYNTNTPRLGIKVQDVEKGAGVKIIEVTNGSDADKAGLKEGDIIKEANGNIVENTDDLLSESGKNRVGHVMKLKIDRNGNIKNVEIALSKKIKTANL